jgi:hypothetical protein
METSCEPGCRSSNTAGLVSLEDSILSDPETIIPSAFSKDIVQASKTPFTSLTLPRKRVEFVAERLPERLVIPNVDSRTVRLADNMSMAVNVELSTDVPWRCQDPPSVTVLVCGPAGSSLLRAAASS